jgi:hypothetical protein
LAGCVLDLVIDALGELRGCAHRLAEGIEVTWTARASA